MQYSFVSAAILALSAVVAGQYVNPTADFDAIYTPTQDQVVAAGSTVDITWQYKEKYAGAVTIQLLQGATPATLVPGQIVANVQNSAAKYTWTVPDTLGADATYGFTITLDSSTAVASEKIYQYSFPFHITAKSAGSSSSAVTGSASTTTVSVSTGSAYTAPASSSTSVSAVVSAPAVPTFAAPVNGSAIYVNTTTATTTYCPPAAATANVTLATTFSASKTSNGTSVPTTVQATGAANGLAISAGLAMIGSVLAFVL